jgi:hypothetical protein
MHPGSLDKHYCSTQYRQARVPHFSPLFDAIGWRQTRAQHHSTTQTGHALATLSCTVSANVKVERLGEPRSFGCPMSGHNMPVFIQISQSYLRDTRC